MSNNPRPNNKQRKDRPLVALTRSILEKIAKCPSSSNAFLTSNGRAMRQSYVVDICKVMTALVEEMDLSSNKVGVATQHGFSLRTWGFVAEKTGLEKWRVKQCMKFIYSKGWVESKQPREKFTGKDNIDKWRGLASIKRVKAEFFYDLSIYQQYEKAKQAAKEWLKRYARELGRPIKYIQTPITLLRRRRKEAAAKAVNTPNAPDLIPS